MSMRLLLVNPNSSKDITDRLALSARKVMGPDDQLTAITAKNAPLAITQPHEVAEAGDRVVELALSHFSGHNAILVGISLDCGLSKLRRSISGVPVLGMTESACLLACARGERFGVLTLGHRMGPLYKDHVTKLGLESRMVGVRAPDISQAFNLPPTECPSHIIDALAKEAQELIKAGADSVVLAGAVLCGYAPALERISGAPVFDGITSAALLARDLIQS